MSRTINESIEQLRTSLGDIKTSLSSKLSGGGDLGNIKVSEVAGYIDQIETGGGGGGFNHIQDVSYTLNQKNGTLTNSTRFRVDDHPYTFSIKFTVKDKQNVKAKTVGGSPFFSVEPEPSTDWDSNYILNSNATYTFTVTSDYQDGNEKSIFVFTQNGDDDLSMDAFSFLDMP